MLSRLILSVFPLLSSTSYRLASWSNPLTTPDCPLYCAAFASPETRTRVSAASGAATGSGLAGSSTTAEYSAVSRFAAGTAADLSLLPVAHTGENVTRASKGFCLGKCPHREPGVPQEREVGRHRRPRQAEGARTASCVPRRWSRTCPPALGACHRLRCRTRSFRRWRLVER